MTNNRTKEFCSVRTRLHQCLKSGFMFFLATEDTALAPLMKKTLDKVFRNVVLEKQKGY